MIEPKRLRRAVAIAMDAHDEFVLNLTYRDQKGNLTRRVVSPTQLVGDNAFRALCLCREEPRMFYFDQCEDASLLHANDVLMPVQIEILEKAVT